MATITATRSVHAALTTTTVDTVELTGHWGAIEVFNREAAGGADLWVTYRSLDIVPPSAALADPAAAAEETEVVPAGTSVVIAVPSGHVEMPWAVKILGNGNDYSVTGMPCPHERRALVVPAPVA